MNALVSNHAVADVLIIMLQPREKSFRLANRPYVARASASVWEGVCES